MSDGYEWWNKALKLAGNCRELTRDQMRDLGVSEGDPQSGFYRTRKFKDGPLVPVAIWRDGGGRLFCLVDGKEVDAEATWTFACRTPITEQTYHAIRAGEPWPDEVAAVPKDHNQVKTGDPAIDLKAEFDAEREQAETFLKKPVTTQDDADRAAVWAKKITGIVGSATNHFKAEKQPFIDGGRNVDERYRWRDDGTALAKRLKASQDAFLREQERLEEERQRKARAEAERIRREAEDAARKAEEAERAAEAEAAQGVASSFAAEVEQEAARLEAKKKAERLAEEAKIAEREAEARKVQAGRTGARTSLRTFYEAAITDYDALVSALKNEPEVQEVITKIVNRIARTQGAEMPAGSERREERRAA